MANERAGIFFLHLESGSSLSAASKYLSKSYLCYQKWGALNKAHDMAKKYPFIFPISNNSLTINFPTHLPSKSTNSQATVSQMTDINSMYTNDNASNKKRPLSDMSLKKCG